MEKKEKDSHLNPALQRLARRDKKVFRSDQCKKKKKSGKQGNRKNYRSFQENSRHQGNISFKNRHNKRNDMDLTDAEDIKKRWQENTEKLYKTIFMISNHDTVITHLEPVILECEVKWALESITMNKASGGDGIPVELF